MSQSVVWTDLAYIMPGVDTCAKRYHVLEDDLEEFSEVYDKCMAAASPKFIWIEADVKAIDDGTHTHVDLNKTGFESHLLYKLMEKVDKAYVHVSTCGRELYDMACECKDPLERFWIDSISETVLRAYSTAAYEELCKQLGKEKLASIQPGSLSAWPINEQTPLFECIGDVYKHIGVELNDRYLMLPYKSASGIYFDSDDDFSTCKYCENLKCTHRRAKYDPTDYNTKYGL